MRIILLLLLLTSNCYAIDLIKLEICRDMFQDQPILLNHCIEHALEDDKQDSDITEENDELTLE